jgi:hypothetical protein
MRIYCHDPIPCRIAVIPLFLIFWLVSTVQGGQLFMPENEFDLLKHCKSLTIDDFHRYVDQLGKVKAFSKLEIIYRAHFPYSWYAATVYCKVLDDEKAVAFCTSLDIDSNSWSGAFGGLISHRKTKVIGYIKQVSTSSDPIVRAECYRLCMSARWIDLFEKAKRDADSPLDLWGPGYGAGETLGRLARRYCRMCIAESVHGVVICPV